MPWRRDSFWHGGMASYIPRSWQASCGFSPGVASSMLASITLPKVCTHALFGTELERELFCFCFFGREGERGHEHSRATLSSCAWWTCRVQFLFQADREHWGQRGIQMPESGLQYHDPARCQRGLRHFPSQCFDGAAVGSIARHGHGCFQLTRA